MIIRRKIILIVLPLMLTPILLTVLVSSLSARNGITIIASEFLRFQSDTLINYAQGQWDLLKKNKLDSREEYVAAAKKAVGSFSATIIRSPTELILAVDPKGSIALLSRDVRLDEKERERLTEDLKNATVGWGRFTLGGESYVGQGAIFDPFHWFVLILEKESVFYASIWGIYWRTAWILVVSLAAAMVLLIIFSNFLTAPLKHIVDVIREIITSGDLSKKVILQYDDETGQLGHYFNLMTSELEKAYGQIKKYAYEMVLAKNREFRIRHIFQKYVPNNVIEQFEAAPENMLKGDNRELAVLFSDIRSFTTISEKMPPHVLVELLNDYFEKMVDVILKNSGIVDKYIGDAIMAFFGAPVKGENDSLKSVQAGLGMMSALEIFNQRQNARGFPPFRIGIGISYGEVTIGNIGSEKKMEYTVIGDMVNLASRLEELTKTYREPIIVSDSVERECRGAFPSRLLDRVIVKGKTLPVEIYTLRETVSEVQKLLWKRHEEALDLYTHRKFSEALALFQELSNKDPEDFIFRMYVSRCTAYLANPPPDIWKGEFVMTTK